MTRAEAAPRPAAHPEASYDGESSGEAWGVSGLMGKSILPDDARERRRRGRLRAFRAMDRLGMLGEGNLLSTLADRPRLRWLADKEGARWAVLKELGRIGEPTTFEEAVEWALENRPRPEEARAYVRRLGSGVHRPDAKACGSVAQQSAPSFATLRRARGKKETRRC